MMKIQSYEFSGQGMSRVYENEKWTVGVKNWKPMNDISGIDRLERHNETDELFVLLQGKCTLVFANDNHDGIMIDYVRMEPYKVYNIPKALWHNTITEQNTKLLLIEDSSTSSQNSNEMMLSTNQIDEIKSRYAD